MEHRNSDTFLRLPEVKGRTGLSRSSIYLYVKKGLFPAPMKLGLRSVGWYESHIQDWIISRTRGNLMLKNKEKAAISELGGSLNYHNSIFNILSRFTQVDSFQAIGYLANKIIQDAVIKRSNNQRSLQDGE